MKKVILLGVALLLLQMAKSQVFPDSNGVWSYYYEYDYQPGFPISYKWRTEHYIMGNSDTIINNRVYNKIFYTSDSLIYNNVFYGALRNEGDKVFFIPKKFDGDTTEYLLYDFSVNIGDTVEVGLEYFDTTYFICQQIDTIQINNNSHKRWLIEFPETYFFNYWIEGIGSTYHLVSSYQPWFHTDGNIFKLLCYEDSDTLVYMDTTVLNYDGDCHTEGFFPLGATVDANNAQSRVLVVPNPVESKSMLKFEHIEENPTEIYVYNATGQLLKTYRSGNQELVIYNKNYEKGIYFIKAIAGSRVFTTKFIIH